MPDKYDYIVIGAGSSGCVLAHRLSTNPANNVLLLEAGGKDWNPWIHIPVGYFRTLHKPATDWCYVTEPDPGLNGRCLKWPRGKVLGGSSSINGLLYIRGQRQDYDNWSDSGINGWSYNDVLPYFRKAEDQERGADDYHGAGGPLKVSNMSFRRSICDDFIAGVNELGVPRSDDFNAQEQEGVGYFQLTAHNGRRCSSAVAYLKGIKSRPNLTIITHALTRRIGFSAKRAQSVDYHCKGEKHTATANAEIILCAGAINSPQLLQLSGIGPGALLREHGIDVIADSSDAGAQLQDHLQIRLVYKTRNPVTLNDELRNPVRKLRAALQYIMTRGGPMSMAASQVAAFCRTRLSNSRPDIQYHFQPLSTDAPGEGLHTFSAITASVCQLRPESRGYIHITSNDPLRHPKIVPNYLSTDLDCQTAVESIKHTRRIMHGVTMAKHISAEHLPGSQYTTDEELLDCARNISNTIYHPTSTCRMGADELSVVDERLRVRGVSGLRVADASIMPSIVSGNTNAPTIMIGEKASDMILEDNR